MARLAPLTALLAWVLLQVPLVVCVSECETSVSLVLFAGSHSCHAVESQAHHERCCGGHGDEAPADPESDDHPGQHTLVQISSLGAGDAAATPELVPGELEAFEACVGHRMACQSVADGVAWRDPVPADRSDLVSMAVSLLI